MDHLLAVDAQGVSKSFGAVRVLHDVSFDVMPRVEAGIALTPFRHLFEHVGGKVGWQGDAKVVTANGMLDYFGQSVNIAARLQAQVESGQLVVEAPLADRALAKGILMPSQVIERYEAHLKGVDQPISAARIAVPRRG